MNIIVMDLLTKVSGDADFMVQLVAADRTFEAPISLLREQFTSWDDKIISEWTFKDGKLIIIC